MKVADLLQQRIAGWHALEMLCNRLEGFRGRRLPPQQVVEFGALYRAACADLALADAYQLPPETISYLHHLVGRAHNQLYRSQRFNFRSWWEEMFLRVPPRLLRDKTVWLSAAIFWGLFLLAMYLAATSPQFVENMISSEQAAEFEKNFSEPMSGRDSNTSAAMAGFYIFHNTGIGLQCFAYGLLLGVGGLFAIAFNGVFLGAVFGFMTTVPARENFFNFVTAHGPFELTAIVFSGAAGMRLGFALVSTNGLRRTESLRLAARQAMPTMGAAMVMFALAAIIEGFISPSGLPYAVKAGVAIVSTILILSYVVGLGWRGAPRAT
jgi:uncharacterized membrane protein SpoIIM required for sporulation